MLARANLTDASVTKANLKGATLTGATLTGVTWDNTTCRTAPTAIGMEGPAWDICNKPLR